MAITSSSPLIPTTRSLFIILLLCLFDLQ